MRTRRLRMRTKNNRRRGGANTIRKAIMRGKINLLKAKCNAKYNMKEVEKHMKEVDKQLKTIDQNLAEIMYQKEKLELKKQALIECQNNYADNGTPAYSFERVMGPGPLGKHAKRVSEPTPTPIKGSPQTYGFRGIYQEGKIPPGASQRDIAESSF